jgi:hypothetical protein
MLGSNIIMVSDARIIYNVGFKKLMMNTCKVETMDPIRFDGYGGILLTPVVLIKIFHPNLLNFIALRKRIHGCEKEANPLVLRALNKDKENKKELIT